MSGKVGAFFTVAVMVMVSSAMALTAVSLLRSGDLLQVGVGAGLLVIVAVGCVLVVGEVRLGAASQRLAERLHAEGGLPSDPPGVTRTASGRLEKADADAVFATRQAEVEASPADWRAWWRLAAAYGDARDPARGRRALRRAVALERAERPPMSPSPTSPPPTSRSKPMTRRRALGLLGLVGAGAAGLAGAVRAVTGGPAPRAQVAEGTTRQVEAYGDLPRQVGEWWLPPGGADEDAGRLPTVVLVHGGYWRAMFDLSLEDAVAADLAARGFLVWNIDYRPSSDPWPATLSDVAAAYDHLAAGAFADRVDPARVAVVGHSAGGHLALWLASRDRLPGDAPGRPTGAPAPALVVPQAPVAALVAAHEQRLGGGAVTALLGGGPAEVPERYAAADPLQLLPTGVPSVLVHGTGDDTVPLSQSEAYVAAARERGDDSRLGTFPGGHFEHLDPASQAVALLRDALGGL